MSRIRRRKIKLTTSRRKTGIRLTQDPGEQLRRQLEQQRRSVIERTLRQQRAWMLQWLQRRMQEREAQRSADSHQPEG